MILRSLRTESFRNLRDGVVELEPGRNVVCGANGNGKTSLLEAVCWVATARSFRTRNDSELPRWGAEACRVTVDAEEESVSEEVSLSFNGRKTAAVCGNAIPRLSDVVGRVLCVLMRAEDTALVLGPPDARRRFLDAFLCASHPGYVRVLLDYQRVLRQRNRALAEGRERGRVEDVSVWDEVLARCGFEIVCRRRSAAERLGRVAAQTYREISSGAEELTVRCRSGPWQSAADLLSAVREGTERDLREGRTGTGPHRDDLAIEIGGREAKRFASRGQAKSAAMALRCAERHYVEEQTGRRPALLVDDMFGELDRQRRGALLELLGNNNQTILTGTDREDFGVCLKESAFFVVESGAARRIV